MAFHGGGEVWPLANCPHPFGIYDLAELRQLSAITLVVRDPIEEWAAITLSEVGSDPHIFFSTDADDVLDCLDIIMNRRIASALQEGREHCNSNEAAMIDDEFQLGIGLIARVSFQSG